MALSIRFFMAPDDERALLRLLVPLQLELWPELFEPRQQPELITDATVLEEPAYYLAAGR